MAKDCLYCGLQFSDTTNFCPNCGRPTERGFVIRPIQEPEFDSLRKEMKGKTILYDNKGSPLIAVTHVYTWKNMHTLEHAQSAEHVWPSVPVTLPVICRLANFPRCRAINRCVLGCEEFGQHRSAEGGQGDGVSYIVKIPVDIAPEVLVQNL